VQTNDVGRSGSLLGGFFAVAAHAGLPIRLLELGSSAGLNLLWDRYRYEWRGGGWGDPASPVRIPDVFVEGAPAVPEAISIADRAGCDPLPVDVRTAEGRMTLRANTWADQLDRMRRLEAAMGIASTVPYQIDQARAGKWLETRLAELPAGQVTVVFHSVVWPYLDAMERRQITEVIENAGTRASAAAPLAWLRMEPGGMEAEVRLRIYPGFDERVMAACGFHTPAVRWHETASLSGTHGD
jgi:hypothetical protein